MRSHRDGFLEYVKPRKIVYLAGHAVALFDAAAKHLKFDIVPVMIAKGLTCKKPHAQQQAG